MLLSRHGTHVVVDVSVTTVNNFFVWMLVHVDVVVSVSVMTVVTVTAGSRDSYDEQKASHGGNL